MRKFILILLSGLILGCVDNKNEALNLENNVFRQKNDSLKTQIDSLLQSTPFVFEKALTSEKNDLETSLTIYKRILENNEADIWTVYAEDRLMKLTEKNKQPLKEIFQLSDTLILRHHNDKCGEWGGDEEIIKIYFKKDYQKGFREGKLIAVYQMNEYDCDSLEIKPYETKPNVYFSKHKELDYKLAKIVEECIFDLLKHKLSNDNLIHHAGTTNTVELKGSVAFVKTPSIFIDDYPSFSWKRFHLLKKELMK
jgi:hypothetical protein